MTNRLCYEDYEVVGIDTVNDYYSVQLKMDRLNQLKQFENFDFLTSSITDKESLFDLFEKHQFDYVINLAAQAGVRYSIDKPYKYIDANLIGFINVLEACRRVPVRHLIFASSSSVYGSNTKVPFSENDHTDHPVSLYAATKKSNEMMAHSYSALYDIPTTGLRFFTVYGSWGRPDMAVWKFTEAILNDQPIKVYNEGQLRRDFTHIDDIVEGVFRMLDKIPGKVEDQNQSPAVSRVAPFHLYNIGNNQPIKLLDFISTLENCLGKKAKKEMLPMQPGDVLETYAEIDSLSRLIDFKPNTQLEEGLIEFVKWYRDYHKS